MHQECGELHNGLAESKAKIVARSTFGTSSASDAISNFLPSGAVREFGERPPLVSIGNR